MTARFHADAEAELLEARAWYEARSPVSALGFAHEVSRGVGLICDAPNRYPKADAGTRRLRLRRYPFFLVYRLAGTEIEIVAVAHQKRRPRYWAVR